MFQAEVEPRRATDQDEGCKGKCGSRTSHGTIAIACSYTLMQERAESVQLSFFTS